MPTNTQKLEQLIRDAYSYLAAKDLAVKNILNGTGADYYKALYREAVDNYADAVSKITAIGMNCAEPEKFAA